MAVSESSAIWPDRAAGAGVQALGDRRRPSLLLIRRGCRSCSSCSGATRRTACFLGDQAFVHLIDGDLHSGDAGALAGAALQDEELALFDGELDVLHVLVVVFELIGDLGELLVDGGILVRELARSAAGCARRPPRLRPARSSGIRRRCLFSPVAALRVKATPVPQSLPMLPKTIV